MYHVIIEADPYDCMGHRVKDYHFSYYYQAKSFYDSFFKKCKPREVAEELGFLPDFEDSEDELVVLNTELTLLYCNLKVV